MEKNASQLRREKVQRRKEREMAELKSVKRKNAIALSIAIISAVLIVISIVYFCIWYYKTNQSDLEKVAVKSKYYTFTLGDMQYLFYDNYNDFMTENSGNVNIDEEKSLRVQYYDEQNGITWYDYFLQQAKDNAESYILLASAAKDDGYTLTQKEQDEIDEMIDAFEEYGAEENYTLEGYIEYAYGEGITEDNIRHCQEIKKIATRYYTDKIDAKTLAYTDDDYTKFLENNFEEYAGMTCKVDYTYFSFEAQFEDGFTEDQKETSRNNAYKLAEELQNSGSADAFDATIVKYIETAKLHEESGITPQEYLDKHYRGSMYYNDDDAFATWAFADERQSGDATVIEIKENVFVAYYINKSIYFDERPTKNFRQILLEISNYESADAARKTALNIITEWETGAATEESFTELVKKHSTDVNSIDNGGLYMYVREDELGVEDFDEWLFDEEHKAGSIGMIKTEECYHVLYMCGDGVPTWQAALIKDMQEIAYNELKAPIRSVYNVTFNNSLLDKIET